MSNYSLVVNSTFQPFTYQELAVPLDRQELYHEKIADEYDKLSSQADVLEAMGANDRDKNSKTYLKYKNYSDNLRKEADNLYQNGLNYDTRQRLSNLRRMYNTDIVPIQNAWNKREQEADMQMKASMQNPSLMFTRDARNSTLDEYIANPTGGFGVINGNNITAQMASMAKNLEKQIREGSARKEDIDPFTYRYIQENGLTPDMIREWRTNPTLSKMFEQVMRANGVTPEALNGSANAQNIIDQSTGYAEMGMWNAIGGTQSQILDNYKARQDYQFELNQRAADAALQRQAALEAVKNGGVGNIPEWAEERTGIETKEGYIPNAQETMGTLKAGNNGLKSSIFGSRTGQVNPMAIYEEYQKELKNHTKEKIEMTPEHPYGAVVKTVDADAAKKSILDKYKKYGVTDILTKEQYGLMNSMGYNNKTRFSGRYSDIENDLNKLAVQHTRYSTKMTGYDLPDQAIRTSISRTPDSQLGALVWDISDEGKLNGSVSGKKKLNLKSNNNTKGNQIEDIQYDPRPEFRGKLIITLSDGSRKAVSPNILDAKLTNAIRQWESEGLDPRIITASIGKWLNTYNKTQSKTDSKE